MNLRGLLQRLAWKPGDVQVCDDETLDLRGKVDDPAQVEYTVWDDDGNLREIVLKDGRRIYSEPPED